MNNSNMEIRDPARFRQAVEQLKQSLNTINDISAVQNKNAERINKTKVWSGDASETLYMKYKELNNNYIPITYSLDLYVRFLEKTLDDYLKLIEAQGKNIDAMAENLDVNG